MGQLEFYSGSEFNEDRVRLTKMEAFEMLLEGKSVYFRTPGGFEAPFILKDRDL